MQYWVLKTEPEEYSYQDLARDGEAVWDGIRNYQARNFLRAMQPGDRALIYHTGAERACVGIAEVITAAFADPKPPAGDWSAIRVRALEALLRPVTLKQMRGEEKLQNCLLLRHSRISVSPLNTAQYQLILDLAGVETEPGGDIYSQ